MKNTEISGILVVDKPEGKSSAFIDRICKKILNIKKIGHIGTLDPFATGLLAIAINSGTKTIPYIKTETKTYEFEIRFGEKTDTGDKTGTVIETSDKIPNLEEIQKIIPNFIGEISQIPHAFSAIKVDGKRAYDLARQGIVPDIKSRKITIFELEILGQTDDATFKLRAKVSPGTYIRTLSEDIAKSLGTIGTTISLRRTEDGKFSLGQSISIDKLEEKKDNIESILIPLEDVLDDIPVILISCQDAENLRFGREIANDSDFSDGEYLAKSDDGFLGIVDFENGIIKPKRLLNF